MILPHTPELVPDFRYSLNHEVAVACFACAHPIWSVRLEILVNATYTISCSICVSFRIIFVVIMTWDKLLSSNCAGELKRDSL